MNDVLTPSWLKQIAEEQEMAEERQRQKRQAGIAAEIAIASGGQHFWEQFIREIALAVEGCKKLKGVCASMVDIGQPEFSNRGFKLTLKRSTSIEEVTLDVRYTDGESTIRCYAPDRPEVRHTLVLNSEGAVELFWEETGKILGPDAAAEAIMRPLVERALRG